VTVMLHGMCSVPEAECPSFVDGATPYGWLVCPRGPSPCADADGASWVWPFDLNAQGIEETLARVRELHPGEVDVSRGRVLVGFSLGALAAMQLAHDGNGRYAGLVLVGAEVYPNAALLSEAGVLRVVMAAGEQDMMRAHMVQQAALLDAQGIPTRFISLGDVGHAYPDDIDERMAEAIAWVRGDAVGPARVPSP
jgi:pimeloyl-ACP methyl ester carboxylesterase